MYFTIRNLTIGSVSVAALVLAGCAGGGTGTSNTALPSTLPQSAKSEPALKCFTGSNTGGDNGKCNINTKTGTVELNTKAAGSYAGVYLASGNSLKGLTLNDIKTFQLTLTGLQSSVPQQGSPRGTIPVNYNGNANDAVYLYVNTCDNPNSLPADSNINFLDSTTCSDLDNHTSSDWSTFTQSFGSTVITGTPFFVSDQPGEWQISDIQIK